MKLSDQDGRFLRREILSQAEGGTIYYVDENKWKGYLPHTVLRPGGTTPFRGACGSSVRSLR